MQINNIKKFLVRTWMKSEWSHQFSGQRFRSLVRSHQCYKEAVSQCSKDTLKSPFNVNCINVFCCHKNQSLICFRCIDLACNVTHASFVSTVNKIFLFYRVMLEHWGNNWYTSWPHNSGSSLGTCNLTNRNIHMYLYV